jgi:hypothetical protein
LEKFNTNTKKGLPNDFTLADIKGAAGAIFVAGGDTVRDQKLNRLAGVWLTGTLDIDYDGRLCAYDDDAS